MNQLMISAVFAIQFLHFASLSVQVQRTNLSDIEQILLQSFKENLLRELGLPSAPNVSAFKVPRIPKIYKHLVDEENRRYIHSTKEQDTFHAKTERIFLFPDQAATVIDPAGERYRFKSNVKNINLEIRSATLWFRVLNTKKPAGKDGHAIHQVSIYKSFKSSALEGRIRHGDRFQSMQLNSTGWHSAEVSDVVKEWISVHTKLNLSLAIAINGTMSLQVGGVDKMEDEWRPFLEVVLKEEKQLKRKRRKADENNDENNDNQDCDPNPPRSCCRHSLEVNFEQIGLPFIVYPRFYNIHACAGSCASHVFSHGYQYRSEAFRRMSLEAPICCRANETAPGRVMYLNDKGLVSALEIPDMQVLSCDCIV
ncbi:growth/differentiation factor 8-like [Montipora foliosa]|uniref:growth/differentiation factor 8-like n=1 Tax=Montipora foliosa TaxID=591990 RepID=UPI0035F17563